MESCSSLKQPICESYQDEDIDETLLKESGSDNEPTIRRFQSLVGSLLWITRCCRPDIGFAVYRVTRKAHAPTVHDWKMAKKILKYLRGTAELKLNLGLKIKKESIKIEVYSDSDWGEDRKNRK